MVSNKIILSNLTVTNFQISFSYGSVLYSMQSGLTSYYIIGGTYDGLSNDKTG